MVALAFLDLETTGLDPRRHQLYEVGLVVEDGTQVAEHRWWVPVDLARADPDALRISNYYGRLPAEVDNPAQVAVEVARATAGAHLVGAVPSFDAAFLAPFLRAHHQCPAWHYHLVDVEALAAGRLGMAPPWRSDELAEALGVGTPEDRHTALGDARWARAVYHAALCSPHGLHARRLEAIGSHPAGAPA